MPGKGGGRPILPAQLGTALEARITASLHQGKSAGSLPAHPTPERQAVSLAPFQFLGQIAPGPAESGFEFGRSPVETAPPAAGLSLIVPIPALDHVSGQF